MLVLSAPPAMAIRSLDSDSPRLPASSSCWSTHPKALSSVPLSSCTVRQPVLERRVGHGGVGREAEHGLGEVRVLAQPGALHDPALELNVVFREGAKLLGAGHEAGAAALARVVGLVAGEVEER
ncbi:hypothetical protein ZWY2020_024344 [Hordeum vulgare]|nr:hypothetical protein ZWY2020_024344 [Hordeum vulgare]